MAAEALLRALKHVWLTLEPLGCPKALMGGIAVSVWKYIRATRDVDLLVSLESQSAETVLEHLQKAGFRPKRQPPIISLGDFRVLQLLYEPPETFMDLQIDILFADSPYQRQAIARLVSARLPGLDLDLMVLACEDLIVHKLLAGRIIDRADAATLLRLNRPTLDLTYLRQWIANLALQVSWAEIWREAFPDEPNPG
jgi:hypothetical protein